MPAPHFIHSNSNNSNHPMKIEPQMTGLPAEKQSVKAIFHTLRRIADNPAVAWHCGHCTQTYALLVEAGSTLTGQSMVEIQSNFPPASPRELGPDEKRECPFCGDHALQVQNLRGEFYYVFCDSCHAQGPTYDAVFGDSDEDPTSTAIYKWNKREMPRR